MVNIHKKRKSFIDLTGNKYTRLTVIGFAGSRHRKSYWNCLCECGNEKIIRSDPLKDGSIRSCGCLNKEKTRERTTIHNGCGTPEYTSWQSMKARCYCKSAAEYPNYGGRGIIVCDRWKGSFINFLSDMGKKPKPEYSLDRINNDGNYESGNCRWASKTTQSRNTRVRKKNKTGLSGVSWTANRWLVGIGMMGKMKYIGRFSSFFEACCARKSAENKYWG